MSLFSFLSKISRRTSDGVVGVASGATPVSWLDSTRVFNTILAVGLVAVGFSGWLIYHKVYSGGKLTNQPLASGNTNAAVSTELQKLKTKDTDGDGLSDYDELYNYFTSPYLKDTDGDGIPDNVEIQNGTDPNCPQGKTCTGLRILTSVTDANGQLTPEFLRQALQTAGVPSATLDKISDSDLLKTYNQIVSAQASSNSNSNSNTGSANTNIPSIATNSSTLNTNTGANGLDQIKNLTTEDRKSVV
jgi:hypothetical protein